MPAFSFMRLSGLFMAVLVAALVAAGAALGSDFPATAEAASPQTNGDLDAGATGSVVFKLHEGMSPGVSRGLLGRLGVSPERVLSRSGLFVVSTDSTQSADALIETLRLSGLVEFVGHNQVVQALEVPNDPDYPRQWHLHTSEGGINAESAWDLAPEGAAGVVVAVIDTGAAFETYSIPGLFGTKQFEPAPDLAGVPIVAPWNFVDNTTHANDDHGHGTHVASTIVQSTSNGISGAGVARGASLMPLKILDYSGNGTGADLVESIYYATENGADVINMSLGFPGSGIPEANGAVCGEIPGLHEALDYAHTNGVVVIAATGNDGASTVSCPAAHPTVISVGATDFSGNVSWFSNGGDGLSITAPGGDPNVDLDADGNPDGILQQTYCFDWITLLFSGAFNEFCSVYEAGTSMASPQVAGVAALLLGVDPQLSPMQIRFLLEDTARDRGPAGWDSSYGYGALDANAAIASLLESPPPDVQLQPYPVPTPYPRPEAPSALVAVAQSSGSVRLTWTNNATNQSGFRIEAAPDSAPFNQIGQTTATNYAARGLTPGTSYQFRVYAYDSQNIDSQASNIAAAATFAVPDAPTNLTTSAPTGYSVSLTWIDNASTETGFRIEKSTDGTNFTFAGLTPANSVWLPLTNLAPATQHWFRVRATDSQNFSEYSNVATATTLPPPEPPSNLQITQATASSVSLSWEDNSPTEQGFRIEKSVDGGLTFNLARTTPVNWTSSTVNFLAVSQSYVFQVRAYAGPVVSAPSNTVVTSTQSAPPAPTNLTATATSATQATLNWTDNAPAGIGYRVERSLDGTSFAFAGSLYTNGTTFTAYGLNADTTYWFRVRAADGAVFSDYSNVAQTTTLSGPSAPSGLALTGVTATSASITWIDNSDGEDGFRIEKSTNGGATFTLAAIALANRTSHTVPNLTASTSYQLRVLAYVGSLKSPASEVLEATTLGPPAAPTNLVAVGTSATGVRLTWTDNAVRETLYRIVRSTDGVTWTTVTSLLPNATAYTVVSLQPVTTYQFRVYALDGLTLSEPSNTATATTLDAPLAPSGLTASVGIVGSVALAWEDNSSHESGFKIERSVDGTNWVLIALLSPNWTRWNNFGTASQTTYHYRILAYDGFLLSDFSNVATITLP